MDEERNKYEKKHGWFIREMKKKQDECIDSNVTVEVNETDRTIILNLTALCVKRKNRHRHNNTRQAWQSCRFQHKGKQGRAGQSRAEQSRAEQGRAEQTVI